jgi:hypothetical protein
MEDILGRLAAASGKAGGEERPGTFRYSLNKAFDQVMAAQKEFDAEGARASRSYYSGS